MSSTSDLLSWKPINRIRRNHALEHATLQILSRSNPLARMAGYSDMNGFWLVGEISTDGLAAAVEEALARLRAGEAGLAIHPNCGTNYVTAGFLAGIAAWLSMLGTGSGFRRKLDRLPVIISVVTLVLIFSAPLGPYLQARFTTQPQIGNLQVARIERSLRQNKIPVHRIKTRG
jgi:Domain of unknown function (DUF6391)